MKIIITIIVLGLAVSAFYLMARVNQLTSEVEGFRELIKNYDMTLTKTLVDLTDCNNDRTKMIKYLLPQATE